jgi:imidazolonepropionase-like amidohydrolase
VIARTATGLLVALPLLLLPAAAPAYDGETEDLAAARELFERNLDAIRRRDREGYLACYLESERLVRTGPEGFTLGYAPVAEAREQSWPDVFDARDLRLVALQPGLVYGTYRYRVRYGEDEQSGLSERLFLRTPGGWKVAASTAFQAPAGTAPPPLALVGATLVDGTGAPPVGDAVVVVRGGRIECAGSRAACPVPEDVGVVDLAGRWLTPGLIDAHVHFSQTGWADGRPDALDVRDRHPYETLQADLRAHPERFLRAYLCAGVTAVFDVGGYPWTWDLARRAERDTRGPRVAATGPLLSTLDFWLNLPGERQFLHLADPEAARAAVRYLAAHGAAAAKVWFIVRPEDDLATLTERVAAAGEEARRAGLQLIVHSTGLAEAKAAVRAGARLLVHSVDSEDVDEEFLALARDAGTIYSPTLTVLDGYRRLYESAAAAAAPAVDDPGGCVDAATRRKLAETAELGARVDATRSAARRARVERHARHAAANLRRVHAAGIPVALGTDAGNPLTLHGPAVYAELEAMQAAGLPAAEVVVAATRNAARAMGREKDLGTLEKDKAADLLVLDADPTAEARAFRALRYVVRGGVLRPAAELRAPAE